MTRPPRATPGGVVGADRQVRRRRRDDGAETRRRIVDAALDSLRQDGYAAATARSIAARGGFNPALIFYHFGGVDDLFLAALERTSVARLERYRAALDDINALPDLVARLRALYTEDVDTAHIAAVQELVAASAFSSDMGSRILALMEPWLDFSEEIVERVVRGTPLAGLVPNRDAAFGMVALYMGLETMTRLTGGDTARLSGLFDSAEHVAGFLAPLLGTPRPATDRRRPRPVNVD